MAGVSVRTIQRLERGDPPSLERAKALASVFEVQIPASTTTNLGYIRCNGRNAGRPE